MASREEGERRRAQEYPLATPAPPARDRGPQILFRERLKNNRRCNFGKTILVIYKHVNDNSKQDP